VLTSASPTWRGRLCPSSQAARKPASCNGAIRIRCPRSCTCHMLYFMPSPCSRRTAFLKAVTRSTLRGCVNMTGDLGSGRLLSADHGRLTIPCSPAQNAPFFHFPSFLPPYLQPGWLSRVAFRVAYKFPVGWIRAPAAARTLVPGRHSVLRSQSCNRHPPPSSTFLTNPVLVRGSRSSFPRSVAPGPCVARQTWNRGQAFVQLV
jgi:hypothetical protein